MNKLKTLVSLILLSSTMMSYAQTAKVILTDINPADYEKPKAEDLDKVKMLVLYKPVVHLE